MLSFFNVLFSFLVLLAVAVRSVPANAEGDDRSTVEAAYRKIDAAYGRGDLNNYFWYCTPDFAVIDQTGAKHPLAELRPRMALNWRRPQNAKSIARRASTKITSIEMAEERAVVRGSVDAELAVIDTMGTVADGHDITEFKDEWIKTPAGWRLTNETVEGFNRFANASPAQQFEAANAIIRQNTRNMMEFDASINFGDCMNSPAMQRYHYERRREVCRR